MVVHAFICYNHLIMCAYNNSNRSLHVNTGLQLEKTSSKPRSLSDWPKEEVIKSYRAAPHIESFVCLPWWAHYMLILEKIPGILQNHQVIFPSKCGSPIFHAALFGSVSTELEALNWSDSLKEPQRLPPVDLLVPSILVLSGHFA